MKLPKGYVWFRPWLLWLVQRESFETVNVTRKSLPYSRVRDTWDPQVSISRVRWEEGIQLQLQVRYKAPQAPTRFTTVWSSILHQYKSAFSTHRIFLQVFVFVLHTTAT